MSNLPTITEEELQAIKAQLRARWPEAVGGELPDVLSYSDPFFAIAKDENGNDLIWFTQQISPLPETPEWIPFLPIPGNYYHSIHGELGFTSQQYQDIIANFANGPYQKRIPIGAEHVPKYSGPLGWIDNFRINTDGSMDAHVCEWNERGKQLLPRFKYVSAELIPEWADPVNTDITYKNMPCGHTLAANPYFKESVLRPLAASDAVWTLGAQALKGTRMSEEKEKPASGEKPTAVQLTEAQVLEFRELKATTERQAIELAEAKRVADAQAIELSEIRKANRVKAFTDEVRGKSDANNRVWFGDTKAHVDHLVKLSEAFGETSPEVNHYMSVNRANAEAMAKSQLFSAIGDGGSNDDTTSLPAVDQINAKAKEMAAASAGALTFSEAFTKVLEINPELKRAYVRER